MAKELTIVEQSGDSFERTIELDDADGNDIDITGWTFVLSLKEERRDPDSEAVIRKEVTTHDSPTNGQTRVALQSNETEPLFGDFWYDLKFKTNGGEVDTILNGVFRIEDSITESI